jgi:multidrug resistance protein
MTPQQKRQLLVLFLTLLMVMVGFGIILPILPFYAQSMGATAMHLGLLFATYSLMQFLFSPWWGRVSDRLGRRPVLLIGLLGMALSFALFGLSQALWMLFAARVLGGLLSSALLPTAMAYVADSTSHEQRGQGMGLLGAAMGLGMVVGPSLGGFLVLGGNPGVPFFVAAGLTLLVAALAWAALPESLGPEARVRAQDHHTRGPLYRQLVRSLTSPVGLILLLAFISQSAFASLFGTFALFAKAKLGFGEREMAAVFTAIGLVGVVGQGLLVSPVIKRWGEARTVQIGLLLSSAGFLIVPLAYDLPSLLGLSGLLGLGNALLSPALSALVSKRAAPGQQGSILGVLNSYLSLGRIVGPIAGGVLFDLLGYSSPYLAAGALFSSLVLLSGSWLRAAPGVAAPEVGD